MPKRKTTDSHNSPIVQRSRLYVAKALEKAAESIESHLESNNEPMADKMAAYATGLKDGLTLLELAAREIANKPSG